RARRSRSPRPSCLSAPRSLHGKQADESQRAEKSVPREVGRGARRGAAEAASRAIQLADAGRYRPGREARPARQGAQVDRALEDPATRAREERARQRDMSAAETSDKPTHSPTIGRVVSNKMQKSVTVSIERLVKHP